MDTIASQFTESINVLKTKVSDLNSFYNSDFETDDDEVRQVFEDAMSQGASLAKLGYEIDVIKSLIGDDQEKSSEFFAWAINYFDGFKKRYNRYKTIREMKISEFSDFLFKYFNTHILIKFNTLQPFNQFDEKMTKDIMRMIESLVRKCILESDSNETFCLDLIDKFGIDNDKSSILFTFIDNNREKMTSKVLLEQISDINSRIRSIEVDLEK